MTWSLTSRGEHGLKVLENRMLRRIFRPKREELTGEWRKFHNEELHNMYGSPSINRMNKKDEMNSACSTYGKEEVTYRIYILKPARKRPL
jgi:hypothetical protein